MKKKFKMRFSYYLIAGFIGFVLQVIGYFIWTKENLGFSQIKASMSMEYFVRFVRIDYFFMFSALFLGIFAVGLFIGSRKEHPLVKICSIVIFSLQVLLLCDSILHLSLSYAYRSKLDEDGIRTIFDTLVAIKNAIVYGTSLSFGVLSFLFIKISEKNKRPISRIVSYIGLVSNALFFVGITIAFFGAISTPSYELLAKWFESSNDSRYQAFSSTYSSMNGLTFASMYRDLTIIQELESKYPSMYMHITVGSVFAIISCITYFISLVGNALFVGGNVIESFDVCRDDNPMSI